MALLGPYKEIPRRGRDVMATVTSDAARGRLHDHPAAVRTLRVIVLCGRVTLAAHVSHLLKARWSSAVLPVARGACRGSEVLILKQRQTMDAFLVQIVLVRGDSIGFHEVDVGVTAGAHRGLVAGIDIGAWIGGFENAMSAVTVETSGDVGVTLQKCLSVLALPVLIQLVRRQVKGPHQVHS